MASEIPTHMHNQKLSIIFDLKFSLCALVICGLLNIIKILTRMEYMVLLIFLVFNNSELVSCALAKKRQFMSSLHIVCCVNWNNPIKEPFWPKTLLLALADIVVLIIPNPGIINI